MGFKQWLETFWPQSNFGDPRPAFSGSVWDDVKRQRGQAKPYDPKKDEEAAQWINSERWCAHCGSSVKNNVFTNDDDGKSYFYSTCPNCRMIPPEETLPQKPSSQKPSVAA